ncbi:MULTISPECIES: LPS translocon maturation chaperone LptM [Burkholderia]|jgi:predicted small lipoprotein YifL|uniref:LPS translocon maturation chaperone LptM n=1 Tax=Burkholderia TaxID=32008 RepID=UPI0005AF15D9|nr:MULTISPECIES: lipoprotein [Burkholderia]ALK29116.1 Lipoprotein, putative [Burkholderia plantarii]MBI0326567.1 lipoprotein [Burkholderia plantarii]WLE57827.1 lipoprotein [Burkholderia plantarii]GLZ20916.1 hypothetical protein Bpla01_44450 [Burkholderia plantarii]
MRVVFQMSAIVAALALAGCGQRGALYLPTVPPLPPKPIETTQPPAADDAASAPDAASTADPAPDDAAGASLTLSPSLASPGAASDATPNR